MKPPHGRADYLLFVDGRAAGVVEAKKEGETLTGVEWQSAKYVDGLPDEMPSRRSRARLPFVYESTGAETRFTNALDPDPASRRVFSFHRPETLAGWLDEIRRHPTAPTLRHRLRALPDARRRRACGRRRSAAIRNLEESLAANRPRALIQMATGSGKTFTAANVAYRLVKYADARRILFLVDRANLGRQTLKEFQGFTTPDDGRKFTELYNVQHLALEHDRPGRPRDDLDDPAPLLDPARRGRARPGARRALGLRARPTEPVPVEYNPAVPLETFDVVIVDECHRSIYGLWRQVLDYFDAFTIGLPRRRTSRRSGSSTRTSSWSTATSRRSPTASTSTSTSTASAPRSPSRARRSTPGIVTQFRDRQTRRTRWEKLDEDLAYTRERSSTARSSRATRSAPSSRRSATGSSPRSSPAAARCRRR